MTQLSTRRRLSRRLLLAMTVLLPVCATQGSKIGGTTTGAGGSGAGPGGGGSPGAGGSGGAPGSGGSGGAPGTGGIGGAPGTGGIGGAPGTGGAPGIGGAPGNGGAPGSGGMGAAPVSGGFGGNSAIPGRAYIEQGAQLTAPSEMSWAWNNDAARLPELADLDKEQRDILARQWLRDAELEHASIASFSRFAMELMAVGAPPSLVAGAHQAALDEVRHAQACFTLAGHYAGTAWGPEAFPFGEALTLSADLAEVAARTAIEGCVGETIAALQAAEQLASASDPAVKQVLAAIAEEESQHAELAWRTVTWAGQHGGNSVREAVCAALGQAMAGALAPDALAHGQFDASLAAHGRLDAERLHQIRRAAIEEVLQPCIDKLLASEPLPASVAAARV